MQFARSVCVVTFLLAPMAVGAQSDDLTYCNKLYDMAVRYRGKAIQGEMRPTADMIVAQEQCRAGRTTEGISTLDQLLRNSKINPPPR
jgi:hypothetical protein